jgi:hypothetical protein
MKVGDTIKFTQIWISAVSRYINGLHNEVDVLEFLKNKHKIKAITYYGLEESIEVECPLSLGSTMTVRPGFYSVKKIYVRVVGVEKQTEPCSCNWASCRNK